jgi:hypothetical protein
MATASVDISSSFFSAAGAGLPSAFSPFDALESGNRL